MMSMGFLSPGPRFKTSSRQIREEGLAPHNQTARDYATTEASFETQIQERLESSGEEVRVRTLRFCLAATPCPPLRSFPLDV